jgi:hypothetical protein
MGNLGIADDPQTWFDTSSQLLREEAATDFDDLAQRAIWKWLGTNVLLV